MKLWTITSDRTKWSNQFTLRRSDSMGNVLDRLEESKGGIIALVEYEDGFLDQFRDVYEKYALQVKEHEEYDNDDYDIYESSDSEYKSKITLGHLTVISDGTRYHTPSFRTIYSTLMSITRNGSVDKVPAGDPIMTIELETNTSISPSGWIKVYRHTAGRYAILHSTGELHLADATRVESFIEEYRKFVKGEKLN